MLGKMLLACLLVLSCSCLQGGGIPPAYISAPNNVQHLQNSTVALVEVEYATPGDLEDTLGQENEAYCTGFFIDQNTVVTANHCTVDETGHHVDQVKVATYKFYQEDPRFTKYVVFDLAGFSTVDDVAILRLHSGQIKFQRDSLALANYTPHAGERVYALGNPVGEYYILTEGIISRDQFAEEGATWVSATADVYFGNSGGPLVDNTGAVLGVCHSITARQSHLGTWASVSGVRDLLTKLAYDLTTTQHSK